MSAAAVVVADGDVVERGVIAGPLAERINGGVKEADGWLAVGFGQLIGQRGEARPQRRRSARPPGCSRIAIVGEEPNVIRDQSDIRKVPPDRGAVVGNHAEASLPAWN